MPRAHCPGCQRKVPILPPREGTRDRPPDLGWRYRHHGSGYGRRCPGSGVPVMNRYIPDELGAR
jgi:hypothetical protein